VHILDDEGRELPAGVSGDIYSESWPEYSFYKDPQKTRATRNDKGWVTAGDIGYLDENGYLFLTDRRANTIVSGGVNIYPQEVEDLLLDHPAVLDVAVIGVPNEEYGEEVKAVVQLVRAEDASDALARELIDYARQRLAHYKCPRSVDFDQDLPRLPNGKLMKRRLKDRYWSDRQNRII
jgi:acyl-coenzyme A synthetase/AMP-(fatty) acid ligase